MYKNLIIAQDPDNKGGKIIGVQVESKVSVEFLSEEGSDMVPLEDLTTNQLRVLVKSLLLGDLIQEK